MNLRLACPLLLTAVLPVFASAANLQVTTFADDYDGTCSPGHCSLREAITAANQSSAQIILEAGDYVLQRPRVPAQGAWPVEEADNQHGDLDITGRLRIIGKGAGVTRIDARQIDRILDIHPGAEVELRDLTLTGGLQMRDGGGILIRAGSGLRLRQVEVTGNRVAVEEPYPALEAGAGGAIANYGRLEVLRSTLSSNRIYTGESQNMGKGGAIYNQGELLVRDSLLSGNRAGDWHETGMGGAIYNQGMADVGRTTFQNNAVLRSGIGGAVLNAGLLKMANSTLSGNQATERGIFENGHLWDAQLNEQARAELVHVTIADNDGWGVSNRASLLIRNSIVAGNRSSEFEDVRNCINHASASALVERGLMLAGDVGNCLARLRFPDEATFTRHLLPLEEINGVLVHPLPRTSAAIDDGVGGCASHDQLGQARSIDGNSDGIVNCDLGAFERAYP